MDLPVFIGVDIGTTGVRAAAYDSGGKLLCYADEFYPLEIPKNSYAEQNHVLIYEKMKHVIKEVSLHLKKLNKSVLGISLSTAMHSFMLAKKKGEFLGNMITWADSRSAEIVREFNSDSKKAQIFYDKTCCPPHSCYPYFKMLWFKNHDKNLNITRLYSLKDYIFENLTNLWCIDKSCACASGLYNANKLQWDSEILESLGLDSSYLPEVVETTFSTRIDEGLAKELHLSSDTEIIIGSSDGVLVNLGIGAFKPGQISATIGTSGAVRMVSNGAKWDSKRRTWCYNLFPDTWIVGGAINNGGIILRWLRDNICDSTHDSNAYEIMTSQAAKIKAGSDGLLSLPFFTGERAPYWNSTLRGMFFGLSLKHTKPHLIRAVMEGICFGLKSIFTVLSGFEKVESIRVSGSFTKSSLWIEILSDILEHDIILPKNSEGVAYGAAMLGFMSKGIIERLDNDMGYERIYSPNKENMQTYRKLFDIYESINEKLQDEFTQIYTLQEQS